MILAIAFYAFSAILLVSAAMVVTGRNPVHSVLFLILGFFNAAALFLILGAEFLALILVIVYVGAVAVLFLFVVMMLDVNFSQLRSGFQRYAPVGATIGVVLAVELGMIFGGWKFAPNMQALRFAPQAADVQNTVALGQLIFTDYVLLFQASGLVLLVAMIGAIVLTLRDRKSSRHQNIAQQVNRTVADTLVVVPVPLGAAMKDVGVFRPLPPKEKKGGHHAVAHEADHAGHGDH